MPKPPPPGIPPPEYPRTFPDFPPETDADRALRMWKAQVNADRCMENLRRLEAIEAEAKACGVEPLKPVGKDVCAVSEPIWPTPVQLGGINEAEAAMEELAGWSKIKITFDTGAGASVAPRESFPMIAVVETAFSKAGGFYHSAKGEVILNHGEMTVAGQDDEFQDRCVIFQACDVTKPLFAGRQAAAAGFRTVLDQNEKGENCSFMEHKKTGQRTPLYIENGVYCFDLWVKSPGFTGQGTSGK